MALRTYLTGIADAIREKKGTTDPINAQDFASEISSISTGGGAGGTTLKNLLDATKTGYYLFYDYQGTTVDTLIAYNDTENVESMTSMFASCDNLTAVPSLNTSKVRKMDEMFSGCYKLTSVGAFDTSQVTKTSYMFNNCGSLTAVPQFDTSSLTNTTSMFKLCYHLESVPPMDLSRVTNMYGMFQNCEWLTSLWPIDNRASTSNNNLFEGCFRLQTIDIYQLQSFGGFANDCYSLTKLIIRTMDTIPSYPYNALADTYHMKGTVNSTWNPDGLQDGRIYVPDDKVDALKAATGWSDFADVIVPLSTLVED